MAAGSIADPRIVQALASAIDSIGADEHVDRLVDLIASLVVHDRVTVVRYSVTEKPEFISHRNYSDAMIARYLETYYRFDPFYAQWREHQKPGVVRLAGAPREPYIAEFLGQSAISDEVGVLIADGPGWCLGIFLDRNLGRFSAADVRRLDSRFPVFAALHGLDLKTRQPDFRRTSQPPQQGEEPGRARAVAEAIDLWPELSLREREVVGMILAGHPTLGIARKLGLSPGTVKNHRRNIYSKLDITTERELFLRYIGVSNT
jgi:DNA-binding CsgD family transcriptional regulator